MGFTIPEGHQICVSPPVNQTLPGIWEDRDTFDPERFVDASASTSEDRFNYVPFGAGRHRCIGESFAYVQVCVHPGSRCGARCGPDEELEEGLVVDLMRNLRSV